MLNLAVHVLRAIACLGAAIAHCAVGSAAHIAQAPGIGRLVGGVGENKRAPHQPGAADQVRIVRSVNAHPITNYELEQNVKAIRALAALGLTGSAAKLRQGGLRQAALEGLTLRIVCEGFLAKIPPEQEAQLWPDKRSAKAAAESMLEAIKKAKSAQLSSALHKTGASEQDIARYLQGTVEEKKVLSFLMASLREGATDFQLHSTMLAELEAPEIRVEYALFTKPDNPRGLKEMLKLRDKLEKQAPEGLAFESSSLNLAPIHLQYVAGPLEAGAVSKIWRAGGELSMLYMHKKTVVCAPDYKNSLKEQIAQFNTYLRAQQKLLQLLEGAYIRDF